MAGLKSALSFGRPAAALAVSGLTLAFGGCGQATTNTDTPAGSASVARDVPHDHDGHTHEHAGDGDVDAAMAGLGPEDRVLAEAQKVCAVSGEPLGSMGTPVKVEHNGQAAFLCCEHCRESFESDPETHLAKLKANGETGAEADAAPADAVDGQPAADAPAGES